MQRLSISLLVATLTVGGGLLSSCAPGEAGGVAIGGLYLPGTGATSCDLPTTTTASSPGGALDLFTGQVPHFPMAIKLVAALGGPASPLAVGGTVLQQASQDKILLESMSILVQGEKEPAVQLLFGSMGGQDTNYIGYIDLVRPNVRAKIDAVTDGDLVVSVQLQVNGHMSRSLAAVSTGPVTYSIEVSKTSRTCAKPGRGYGCVAPGMLNAPACCDGITGAADIGCP